VANPIAVLRSAAMMLDYIGQPRAAERIEASVRATLSKGIGLTRDLGGTGNTATITEQLIANL
jgi:isocitrate dehydrogenase (NAD+)